MFILTLLLFFICVLTKYLNNCFSYCVYTFLALRINFLHVSKNTILIKNMCTHIVVLFRKFFKILKCSSDRIVLGTILFLGFQTNFLRPEIFILF